LGLICVKLVLLFWSLDGSFRLWAESEKRAAQMVNQAVSNAAQSK